MNTLKNKDIKIDHSAKGVGFYENTKNIVTIKKDLDRNQWKKETIAHQSSNSIYILPKYYHGKNMSNNKLYVSPSASSAAATSLKKLVTEAYVPELSPIIKNNIIDVNLLYPNTVSVKDKIKGYEQKILQASKKLKSTTVDEIDKEYNKLVKISITPPANFIIVKGVNALEIARSKLVIDSIIQVASQFNFLESINVNYMDITNYINDKTQGPQLSIASLEALILRDNSVAKQKILGQQDGIFKNIPNIYKNGYLIPWIIPDSKEKNKILKQLTKNKGKLEILAQKSKPELGNGITFTQVFSAAPSFQGYNIPIKNSLDDKFCKLLVPLQYACIAKLAAIQNVATGKSVNLHLTLLGQGQFNNRPEVMNLAMSEIYKNINGYNVNVYIHAFNRFNVTNVIQSLIHNNIFYSEMTNEEFFTPFLI